MGTLKEFLFGKKADTPDNVAADYFKLLNGYTPVWRTFNGSVYESHLVRAAIDAKARHVSKLSVESMGTARPEFQS